MSGRLGELDPLSGFKPGVVRLVGTIVGAIARRNSRSSNRGGAKVKKAGPRPYILYIALGLQLIIDLMERISYQRKVTALTSSSCGSAVNGKVLQVNMMARINPRP